MNQATQGTRGVGWVGREAQIKVEGFFEDGRTQAGAFEVNSHVEIINLVAKAGEFPFEYSKVIHKLL
jgi:hypothetical protein